MGVDDEVKADVGRAWRRGWPDLDWRLKWNY